jgi:hypothetical protein
VAGVAAGDSADAKGLVGLLAGTDGTGSGAGAAVSSAAGAVCSAAAAVGVAPNGLEDGEAEAAFSAAISASVSSIAFWTQLMGCASASTGASPAAEAAAANDPSDAREAAFSRGGIESDAARASAT